MGSFIFEGGIQKGAPSPWIAREWFQIAQGECEQVRPATGAVWAGRRNAWAPQSGNRLSSGDLSRNDLHSPGSRAESKEQVLVASSDFYNQPQLGCPGKRGFRTHDPT